MSRGDGRRGAHFAGGTTGRGGSGRHLRAGSTPTEGARDERGKGDEVQSGSGLGEKSPDDEGRASAEDTAVNDDDDFSSSGDYESVGRSARLMTGLIVVSRLTGFVRTWVMGVALGVSMLSTSYQVAQNLPSMLYDLVMGGMLVTAFLPVYMDVRRKQGKRGAEEYIGNLLGILLLILGVLSVVASVFAPAFIWTQSFMSGDTEGMDTAVLFFRFFAFQILFYGLSSVFSGVLNAHRDYFWSNLGPILNNIVVITGFALFPVLEGVNELLAIIVLAVSATLGVFVQMACQIPALRRHGIHPRVHIDFHDPALRQTLSLGIPTLVSTVCTFVTTSVQNAAALVVQPETGASVISYARLWYTLPYALLAVSLTTALYTELARDAARGDVPAVRRGVSTGIGQMMFYLIPFALYLMVFSTPLNMIYCAGKFSLEGVALVSEYLRYLAIALPFYGMFALMQKSCSALMDMRPYAVACVLGAIGQILVVMVVGVGMGAGMPAIAASTAVSYIVSDIGALVWMRRRLNGINLKTILHGVFFGLLLGGLGAAAGGGVYALLESAFGSAAGSVPLSFVYVVVAGVVSLLVTFVPAVVMRLPEASMISSFTRRFSK